jgi:CheY-like chemotaxis protein
MSVNPLTLAGQRVLVVEDEPLIAILVGDYLTELGCVCIGPFGRLPEALEAARTAPIDAAILNLVIGGRHAYEVAAILAQRDIPFAFASGMAREGIAGPWADRPYMTKPYTVDDVRIMLLQLFKELGPAASAPPAAG